MKHSEAYNSLKNIGVNGFASSVFWTAWISVCLASSSLLAYPPAPHHLFYGMVRDELGNPIRAEDAQVIFETASGARLTAVIESGLLPGTNYRLEVPMDAGITEELYKPTALRPRVPFIMSVRIGSTVFLPIELNGDFSEMGLPGKSTRLDLTLGEDSDGDGLPDAWERQLIQARDDLNSLSDVNGADDSDGDGLSNLDEYISGNYAYDDQDGFSLQINRINGGSSVLEFLALSGRSYTVYASNDLENWSPVDFQINEEGQSTQYRTYQSEEVRNLKIEVEPESAGTVLRYFKLHVQ